MKIRYYLRGLGLGILFTAIFFLVSNNSSSQTMSDEQIKARAKELGMIESTVLAELPEQEVTETESSDEEIVAETLQEALTEEALTEDVLTEEARVEESSVEADEEITDEEESKEPESESEETTAASEEAEQTEPSQEEVVEESEQIAVNTSSITVVVNRGEGSDTVSRRLAELGLVADAHEYDKYLMTNGYDKRIGAGEHVIPAGATWEEIAKILCNQM